jgi:DNA invertase Pin-like site-specific DNA recombinase
MTHMTNVVGYVRVSTEKQDVSLEAQEAQIRAMAVVKGWELAEVVVDRDEFSGDMERPGLQRVLEMVKGKQVGALIIAKLDRLTRSTRDVIHLIDLFNKKKVTLVSLAESLDTKSSMGRFFVRMIASLAELERETIGDRTRTGMGHLKSLGMPVGPAPYGWRAQQSNRLVPLSGKLPLVEDAAEQALLQQVQALRADGMSLREITHWLNAAGHKTRRGTAWRFQYVARLVKGRI